MDRDLSSIAHVAIDWGTSSFRLWALDSNGRILAERRSGEGAVVAAKLGFETVLESHLAALAVPAHVPVMICGMAGSRAGWIEATYLDTPAQLDLLVERAAGVPSARRPVRILPGIAQRKGEPDVIRGEETILLAVADEDAHLVCLPGTHSKWTRLDGRVVESFATFMTGEMFHWLRTSSIVAGAVERAETIQPNEHFTAGVEAALANPALATNLPFTLRAEWLLSGTPPEALLARLSGLLIGVELAGARRLGSPAFEVVLVASDPLSALYKRALEIAGAGTVTLRDAEDCVRIGLHIAARSAFANAEGFAS
ncbi:2-dehydro-3-deoxygalactonokinase [Flaviflagellibacter deserti]|uniref:2-dehydro-3-deoxygalactonokinase n=1 Tax=Flaviflagellibacter deserti TaxID=2267266 RepID=A0ABV9Z747_9HYPH